LFCGQIELQIYEIIIYLTIKTGNSLKGRGLP